MPMIIRNNIRYAGGSGGSNGSGENIVELTQAEYDALGDVVNSDNITYYITDSDEQLDASGVAFDDTETQLGASDIQGAIKKVATDISELNSKMIDVSSFNTLQEVFALATSGIPMLCYAEWNSPIAQTIDSQNVYLFITNWTCMALTYKGDIYRANKDNPTFYKANQGIVMTLDGTTLNIQTDTW